MDIGDIAVIVFLTAFYGGIIVGGVWGFYRLISRISEWWHAEGGKEKVGGAAKDVSETLRHGRPNVSKYEELKILKELLDSGAISQEEYDREAKKIKARW